MSNQENFENREKNRKKKRWMLALLILLLLLLITSCSVTIWSIFFRDTTPTLAPDYAPQEIEPNAQPTPEPEDTEKLDQVQGGGSVSLQYTKEAAVDLSDGMVYLSFANPGESNQDIVLQVIVQGKVIAQSKLLPPGNSISQLPLLDGVNLSPGGYNGKFTAAYYYENGEKAIIQTDIPLVIRVQN